VVSVCKTGDIHIRLLPKVDRTVKWRRIERQKSVFSLQSFAAGKEKEGDVGTAE
jgi:hypothetical protein